MIKVISQSTAERNAETVQLFEQVQPLLDQGHSYNSALRKIRKDSHGNYGNLGWYKDLIHYGESQGYPWRDYKRSKHNGM